MRTERDDTADSAAGRTGYSRLGSVWAILRKDLIQFSRDRMFVFITVLGMATFVGLYWLLPRNVDETIDLGIVGDDIRPALEMYAERASEGLNLYWYDDGEVLRSAVEEKDVEVGLEFREGFVAGITSGQDSGVTLLTRPELPEEYTTVIAGLVRELGFTLAGTPPPVSMDRGAVRVLGQDMAGNQISLREKMRPLYAFMILVLEAVALGALIASEVQRRTITAILATPARIGDVLTAKVVVGTLVAFSEAAIVMVLINGYGESPVIVLVTIFIGAVLITAVAMLAGSMGKDLMGTMLFGLLFLIPLCIPTFAVLLPGEKAVWIRVLPTFGLAEAILDAAVHGGGWADVSDSLLSLAGWTVGLLVLGSLVLKRRAESL
jgi:ABC-2 type transport system permease protein